MTFSSSQNAGESGAARARRLAELTTAVAADLGISWEEARSRAGVEARHAATCCATPDHIAGFGSTINTDAFLFETKIAEGDAPSEMCEILALISGWGGLGPVVFADDLSPFRIRVLDPVRTLAEKLVAVHHATST